MNYMKASAVLAEPRNRIATGHERYCCHAIKFDVRSRTRENYPAVTRAMDFFMKYKPERVADPDDAWWDKYDIESRLSALRKAEHDAIVAGD
jgi:hypothetical protein